MQGKTSGILTQSMKLPMKTSPKRMTAKTPKTDNLVNKVQSMNLPYYDAFYELLELARAMEREVVRRKNFNKPGKTNKPQLEPGRKRQGI